MTLAAALTLIVPGAALLLLLYLIATARPDPTRAIHAEPQRRRKSPRERGRSRRRGIPI